MTATLSLLLLAALPTATATPQAPWDCVGTVSDGQVVTGVCKDPGSANCLTVYVARRLVAWTTGCGAP